MPDLLTTEHFRVRELEPTDLDALHAVAGDPRVMAFVGDGKPLSRHATREWIARARERYASGSPTTYAVVDAATGQLVGYGGLVPLSCTPNHFEVVYGLAPSHWGRGLGKELVKALVDWAFLRWSLTVLYATVDPQNGASRSILKGLGMTLLETRRDEHGLPEQLYRLFANS